MTRTNDNRTNDSTRRFPVTEAAGILGISTEATRQRIKRGTLTTERDADGNVFVLLDTDSTRTTGDGTHTNTDRTGDSTGLASLIESQQNQIEFLRQQLQAEREANRENRRLLAAALERIPAIEAPPDTSSEDIPDERESPVTASEDRGDGEGRLEQEQVPWWRKLFK